MRSVARTLGLIAALAGLLALAPAASAAAEGLPDLGGAEWRIEQPEPPPPPVGVEGSSTPIGLGRIGDIEFWAPNRGALITAGNGSTVPPGVWLYNGESWREIASVCGATDGRIAWAGPDEFWTISDGRPGQATVEGQRPPLQDDTLCRFAPPPGEPSGRLEVLASYAAPAFLPSSYMAMHAASCISANDCWFAGNPLPSPQIGSFQLHWNGHSLEPEPYLPEGHSVRSMSAFEGRLYDGVRLLAGDRPTVGRHPPPMHVINAEGAAHLFEGVEELPLYGPEEFYDALDFLHLSASGTSLWAAAGPALERPAGSEAAGVTVIRTEAGSSDWTQVLGPDTVPTGLDRFAGEVVDSIAAEPAGNAAWLALDSTTDANREEPSPTATASVARISADGTISDELQLPSSGESYGPKGAADKITCPAARDCWLATTHGWLVHLAPPDERQLPRDTDPAFGGEEPIAVRPLDLGLPQVPPDLPPVDDSGLEENKGSQEGLLKTAPVNRFATVTLPLLSGVSTHLVHGTTLELWFRLSVKARVRLLAERRRSVVASTPASVLNAGAHRLELRLNRRRWPTKLNLQTHALAPLRTTSTRESNSSTNTVSTSLVFPGSVGLPSLARLGSGPLG